MIGKSEYITRILIEFNADVNMQDKEGETPIHFAAAENASNLITIISESGLFHL